MNIFILDEDPVKAAVSQCDKHVVKMVLESAQLASTAVAERIGPQGSLYRPTHRNHPCSLWVRESRDNFSWLLEHSIALAKEYTFRYGKSHKSQEIINLSAGYLKAFKPKGLTPFPQAMPEKYRSEDPVGSYRDYYLNEKSHILVYTRRQPPKWANGLAVHKEV